MAVAADPGRTVEMASDWLRQFFEPDCSQH
jgi:hypothetical protein